MLNYLKNEALSQLGLTTMPSNLDYALILVDGRFRGSTDSRLTSAAHYSAQLQDTSHRIPVDCRVKNIARIARIVHG